MTTVGRWTGREAKLLWDALRLSVRDFAARLGVGVLTVNKWEARQADITPLPHMQEVLDADELPRQVGVADVDAIQHITDALRRCDFAHGGGLVRVAAIAQLRSVLRLGEAATTSAARVRLDILAADLAMLAA